MRMSVFGFFDHCKCSTNSKQILKNKSMSIGIFIYIAIIYIILFFFFFELRVPVADIFSPNIEAYHKISKKLTT